MRRVIDPLHKSHKCIRQISHNAPLCNRNVHTCTFLLQNGALWDMGLMHCGIYATGSITYNIANHKFTSVFRRPFPATEASLSFTVNGCIQPQVVLWPIMWNPHQRHVMWNELTWLAAVEILTYHFIFWGIDEVATVNVENIDLIQNLSMDF